MNLLGDARKNPAVNDLYQQVDEQTPITFTEMAGNDGWSSETTGGVTRITGTPTTHPDAAMAHELLHAKLKIGGYKRYCTTTAMHLKQRTANVIASMLDNELQHHKMFADFLSMGFQPEQFYHDDDSGTYAQIRKELKAMKRTQLPEEFLRPFVTIIAPGGAGGEDERIKLRNFFRTCCPPTYQKVLCNIEQEIAAWATQPSLDAGDTIVKIFELLGGYDHTWIGWDAADFPTSGHFIGPSFTMQQAQAWLAQNAR